MTMMLFGPVGVRAGIRSELLVATGCQCGHSQHWLAALWAILHPAES